jgi:hypothetical protein
VVRLREFQSPSERGARAQESGAELSRAEAEMAVLRAEQRALQASIRDFTRKASSLLRPRLPRFPFRRRPSADAPAGLMSPRGACKQVVHQVRHEGHVEFNAQMHFADAVGATPLHWAASAGQDAMADVLVELGADGNAPDACGATPLHAVGLRVADAGTICAPYNARVGGRYAEAALSILRGGADPNRADAAGNTPMHCAAHTGQAEVVSALREWGGDPTARNAAGETPVHRAMAGGHTAAARAMVEGLQDIAAAVHAKDCHGLTALQHAVASGHLEAAAALAATLTDVQRDNFAQASTIARRGLRDDPHRSAAQALGPFVLLGTIRESVRYAAEEKMPAPTRTAGWERNDLIHARAGTTRPAPNDACPSPSALRAPATGRSEESPLAGSWSGGASSQTLQWGDMERDDTQSSSMMTGGLQTLRETRGWDADAEDAAVTAALTALNTAGESWLSGRDVDRTEGRPGEAGEAMGAGLSSAPLGLAERIKEAPGARTRAAAAAVAAAGEAAWEAAAGERRARADAAAAAAEARRVARRASLDAAAHEREEATARHAREEAERRAYIHDLEERLLAEIDEGETAPMTEIDEGEAGRSGQ